MPEDQQESVLARWHRRLPPLFGTAVLVLTATPWMRRPVEGLEASGNLESSYTLWGMLATVNSTLFSALVTGMVLIMLSVAAAVLPTRAGTSRAVAAWLGVAAIVGILLNLDGGYHASASLVLSLVLSVACAALLTAGAIREMGRRTLDG